MTPWRANSTSFSPDLHRYDARFPVLPTVPFFGKVSSYGRSKTRKFLLGTKFWAENSDRFTVASGILVPRCPPMRMPEVCWFMTFYPVREYISLYPRVGRGVYHCETVGGAAAAVLGWKAHRTLYSVSFFWSLNSERTD